MPAKKKPSNRDLLALAIDTYTAAKVSELIDLQKQQQLSPARIPMSPGGGVSSQVPGSSQFLLNILGLSLAWLCYLVFKGAVIPAVGANAGIQDTFLGSAFAWVSYLLGVCDNALAVCVKGRMAPNVPLSLVLIGMPLVLLRVFRNGDLRICLASALAFGVLGSYLVAGKFHLMAVLGVILSAWVAVVIIVFAALYAVYVLVTDD